MQDYIIWYSKGTSKEYAYGIARQIFQVLPNEVQSFFSVPKVKRDVKAIYQKDFEEFLKAFVNITNEIVSEMMDKGAELKMSEVSGGVKKINTGNNRELQEEITKRVLEYIEKNNINQKYTAKRGQYAIFMRGNFRDILFVKAILDDNKIGYDGISMLREGIDRFFNEDDYDFLIER